MGFEENLINCGLELATVFLLWVTWVEMGIPKAPDLKNRLPNKDNNLSDVMKTIELWVILC